MEPTLARGVGEPHSGVRFRDLSLRKGWQQVGFIANGRAVAVIGHTRLYCTKAEGFRLVEVPTGKASSEAKRLRNQGWTIDAAIPV